MKHTQCFRQVHLDFHTSPMIRDIARDFDPEAFARTLKDAHVDSVTCFARCHHGWLYYDSKAMPERVHPHLQNRDLLKEQINACHRLGIKAPVYTTVQWDDKVAKEHYDWLVLDDRGGTFSQTPFKPGFYRNLCLNSGYVDFLKAQVRDMFDCLGTLDGVFLDILNIKPCCCPNCVRDMQAEGLDAADENVRYEFAQRVFTRFERDMTVFIHNIQPGCPVFYNAGFLGTRHRDALDAFTHLEIESLPGGSWGYAHFPVTARYARTLGLDFSGMTGKFHTDWGDFGSLRNDAALEYECFKSLAYGGKCSIGDQLHPLGVLNPATYQLIGRVYEQVEKKEPWCRNAVSLTEAAVLAPQEFRGPGTLLVSPDLTGAVRMLTHLGVQFDVIDSKSDFTPYRLLILPDDLPCEDALSDKIEAYLAGGGAVLASRMGGYNRAQQNFASWMPVDDAGDALYSPDYLVAEGDLARGLVPDNEYVMYDRARSTTPRSGAQTLLRVNGSYFDRTWEHFSSHRQAPSSGIYVCPGAVVKGRVLYFAHPLFTIYNQYGCRWLRLLVDNAICRLMPGRMLTHNGPSTLEITLTRQADENRMVLHALHYIPERRSEQLDIVEDAIPLYNVQTTLRVGTAKITSVRTAPEGRDVPFTQSGDTVTVTIHKICGHQMLELTYRI